MKDRAKLREGSKWDYDMGERTGDGRTKEQGREAEKGVEREKWGRAGPHQVRNHIDAHEFSDIRSIVSQEWQKTSHRTQRNVETAKCVTRDK